MRAIPGLLLALTLGTGLGLTLTWAATRGDPPAGAVRIGPWTAWPRLSEPNADAYSRAWLARSGTLALEPGEGAAFLARTDSSGRPLDVACRYRISPVTAGGRLWTLAPGDLASLRVAGTGAVGTAGRDVTAGPGGDLGPASVLTLRLYGLPISAHAMARTPPPLPRIRREECR